MSLSNAQLAADFAAAYTAAYPARPGVAIRLYGQGAFEICEGWGKRTLSRADMKSEIARMVFTGKKVRDDANG